MPNSLAYGIVNSIIESHLDSLTGDELAALMRRLRARYDERFGHRRYVKCKSNSQRPWARSVVTSAAHDMIDAAGAVGITASEISHKAGCSMAAANAALNRLMDRGIASRIERGRYCHVNAVERAMALAQPTHQADTDEGEEE